jgi:tetratricopeptide (TPR) repeat protein
LGEDHASTINSINNLAFLYQNLERYDEAEPLFVDALDRFRRKVGEKHPSTLITMGNLGAVYNATGRYEEAAALHETVVAGIRAAVPPGHWLVGVTLRRHGEAMIGLERFEDAEEMLLESYGVLEAGLGPANDRTRNTAAALVVLYEAWHAAAPDDGHDAQLRTWRASLATDDDPGGA